MPSLGSPNHSISDWLLLWRLRLALALHRIHSRWPLNSAFPSSHCDKTCTCTASPSTRGSNASAPTGAASLTAPASSRLVVHPIGTGGVCNRQRPLVGAFHYWQIQLPQRWPSATIASYKVIKAERARRITRTCTCLTSPARRSLSTFAIPRCYALTMILSSLYPLLSYLTFRLGTPVKDSYRLYNHTQCELLDISIISQHQH